MKFPSGSMLVAALILGAAFSASAATDSPAKEPSAPNAPVSFYRDIRPIFQANCLGCHQPSRAKGGYVMTDFTKLLAGGDSVEKGEKAVVPKNPAASLLLKQITPENGEAEMPKGKPALHPQEVELVKNWIAQGAQDDTPPDAHKRFDAEHPPIYTRPPVISSIDFSPDGQLIAVAGFHEVLLHKADGSGIAARLVGLSERVQSVRFSPDGKKLAVAGGDPARMGEVQIWEVETRKLKVSEPVSYDSLYGVSWSPDGKLVAVGCADNTVRALDASNGKQILQMGSHTDWPMATTFSVKGDHIISGGRDMTVKLTEVATQRFIDNVTSITPGALKGGILTVAAHPKIEHVVVAGADGLPKVYRIFRETKRIIGDDAQLIAELFPMAGRVFDARFSADGKKIACGSSFDGTGEVLVCSYDYDADVPENLRKIMGEVPAQRKPEEQKQLADYRAKGIREIARAAIPQSAIYAVAFSPDGDTIAAAGSDGKVRLIDAANGSVKSEFMAAPVAEGKLAAVKPAWAFVGANKAPEQLAPESLPDGAKVVGLEVQPSSVKFASRNDYVQLIVNAKLESGDTADVTRIAKFQVSGNTAEVSPRGVIRPLHNGDCQMTVSLGNKSATAPIQVALASDNYRADFIRDVAPVLARLGCNAGTCHGAKEGKSGFKLSLRGYDPEYDVRALTDDLASRRVNVASPDDSLMLLKAVAEVPHEGGRRTTVDEKYYQIIRQWIADGAKLKADSGRVARIEVFPRDPVVQKLGGKQQMRVVATFADGVQRDVTAEAFIESGDTDVAAAETGGLITTLRRGEAPVLARYEGNYAATTVTVMGDRTGFAWQQPETWGRIDELVAEKWKRMKIEPSELCNDEEFIRRVYLDLTGLPPSADDVRAFVADARETRAKRDALIDKLIGSPEFVDHWTNKWADLLQCTGKFLGREGSEIFRNWIHGEIEKNTPYNEFAAKILTATGSNRENPAASYWKVLRTPTETMENTTHLFLATRFNCNKCHDHPFERWTQDQYYHTAQYFAQVALLTDPASGDRKIGGTAVEGAKPLFEIVKDTNTGDVKHDRTGKVVAPEFPYPAKTEAKADAPRRAQLAAWITSADNRFFASSYVNRLWGYLTGVGIIEPLDDIRAGNPPTNPELLDHLTKEFIGSGFNVRHVMALICKSRSYQLALRTNKWNEDDKTNYSHAIARRLPAETLFDAVFKSVGSTPQIAGAKPGMRAAQLPDAGMDTATGLLANLGRPARESACECERSNDIRLGAVMALLSGPTIANAIGDPNNALAKLTAAEKDDSKLIDEVFMRILNRPATTYEISQTIAILDGIDRDHKKLTTDLAAIEKKFAPVIAEEEKQRNAAIEKAKGDLASYEEATKFYREQVEKQRNAAIAAARQALADYEKILPAKFAEWESQASPSADTTKWVVLDAKDLKAEGGINLAKQKDGSILASGAPASQTAYTVTAETELANITGVMLEVLPDESLPNFGPGRAKDGNFVLTEFQLRSAAKAKPEAESAAKFTAAKADFNQKDFDVKEAIDGKPNGKGWALSGAQGQPHFATFKLEKPLGDGKGTVLRFTLQQRFRESFNIGRFRLWVTTSKDPLDFGLPLRVADAAQTPAADRTPEQFAMLIMYHRRIDAELRKRQQALFLAKQPAPVDPKFTGLQTALAKASEPIKLDAKLVQLREDTAASTKQIANKRLTAVQDLAWALINNAAFLFNR
jgi:WD40 repeat protein/mono/diheme cytochrome c family protein